ncbi:hypothetical protein DY000_02009365 [Brassica cretica]|uniref:Uncharacterized protein n=1 Tax=Brassica cretica TaxID=69181 RepID=A0ABQ7C3E8_BRACR|nr:hypothetical protein DY000_02009365 [Brassica cretica]
MGWPPPCGIRGPCLDQREVGGSTRGLTRRGDWRSLFCSITELPQTKLLMSATLDCSLLKVEAGRTDPEAGGEEEVREKTEPEAGEDRTSRRLNFVSRNGFNGHDTEEFIETWIHGRVITGMVDKAEELGGGGGNKTVV